MKQKHALLVWTIAIGFMAVSIACERTVTNEITKTVTPATASYMGSSSCGSTGCHEAKYTEFMKTGHPYKLNEASDVQQAGYYPYSSVPTPPPGVNWADVDKVIGGFRWKARFIDNDGFIITGDQVQYNLETGGWVAYHSGETKPYDCGPCHMTNYKPVGNQEGKPGLIGTWEANGIQCEECHGPGEAHESDPLSVAMKIDRSNEGCGKCHIRGDVNAIPASGGFIRHHEQWNEMASSQHRALQCVDCHDVHESLHPLNPNRDQAINVNCENCHIKEYNTFQNTSITQHKADPNGPECIDCHMPKAAKSAIGDLATYSGDVPSHLFQINTDPSAEMFTADGKFANGYLTLDYSCLKCHSDKDKTWAAANVSRVHVEQTDISTSCFSCHSDKDVFLLAKGEQWQNSKHASGDNIDRNRNNKSFYAACEKCHTSEGFVANLAGGTATGDHFSSINCFTCHAPHTNGDFKLRVETPATLANGATFDKGPANLCASCHQSRQDASTYVTANTTLSAYWGPHHSNQADMLIGVNAYEYAGYSYGNSAHTNVTDEGCIQCHMDGGVPTFTGGHTWIMHDKTRNFQNTGGCNDPNCHNGSISDFNVLADVDFNGNGTIEGVQDEINSLADSLKVLLIAANLVDASGTPLSVTVTTADSAGAVYNFKFVEEDRSEGIHNTDYTVGLLKSSINFLNTGNPNGAPPLNSNGYSLRR